jgi:hypothetical protein
MMKLPSLESIFGKLTVKKDTGAKARAMLAVIKHTAK